MTRLVWCKTAWAAFIFLSVGIAAPSAAQIFTTAVNFNGSNGSNPVNVGFVQGTDGDLYGTTAGTSYGTVLKVGKGGVVTILYEFSYDNGTYPNGAFPESGMVLGTDENFYGTTAAGGPGSACYYGGCGTIFRITRGGVLTTLHVFELTDGADPISALVQGTDGNFYGTTRQGGANDTCDVFGTTGCGTIFKITPQGALTTLHNFEGIDGGLPWGSLVQASDGNFYGTTEVGGEHDAGTVFRMTPAGKLTRLYSFCSAAGCADGEQPLAGLVEGSDGNFYGSTSSGGQSCSYGFPCGTVFKITPSGRLTTIHDFDYVDGYQPEAPLVQATDGNFYGTTYYGGISTACSAGFGNGCGTVFKMTPAGVLTTIHSFQSTDGQQPDGSLAQDTSGVLYSTTSNGGVYDLGTIFSVAIGAKPFVVTVPTARKLGQGVIILGTNLTGTISVTFNGTPATFRIVSATEISTTVPSGATSGPVQVVTPGGTLKSNVPFRVIE